MSTVVEAEAALKTAKDAELQKRVEDAKRQLKEIRAQAKTLRQEHFEITRKIAETDAAVAAGRAEMERVEAAIIARRDHVDLDILSEPEDWDADIAALVAHGKEVIQRMNLAQQRGPDRSRQAQIALQVQQLQQAAVNLTNVIENKGKFAGLTSGLSYV